MNSPRIFLSVNSHRSVLEHGDTPSQVGDHLGRDFTFLCDASSEFASILLNVLDVSLEFGAKLLEVLYDGTFDRLGEVGMVIGNQTSTFTLDRKGKREFEISSCAMLSEGKINSRHRRRYLELLLHPKIGFLHAVNGNKAREFSKARGDQD